MASISPTLFLSLFFFAFLFLSCPALAADSPANSPSLPPQPPADEDSPNTPSPASSPSGSISSPPAPPPSDLAQNSPSHAPSPLEVGTASGQSPAPAPSVAAGVSHETQPNAADLETKEESSGGMNSGQKVGMAIGVIAGACVVGAGALVYKKRQENLRRSQYGYAARRETLRIP